MALPASPPWPLKVAVVFLAGVAMIAAAAALTVFIALAGLGRLTPEVDVARIPGWVWYFREDPQVRRWVAIGLGVSGLGGCALVVKFIAGKPRSEHGAARWATRLELRRGDLRAKSGLLLGYHRGQPLRFGGEEHVVVYAPTRSGKGVGFVIPNLLTWPSSAVVLDIKGENYRATAGHRASMGQTIHFFDPFAKDGRTACYNPLGHIERDKPPTCQRELGKVAILLFPEHEKGGDFFWVGAARNAFVAVGMYVAESKNSHPDLTLGAITRELTVSNLREHLTRIIEARSSGPAALSRLCLERLRDAADSPPNTFSNIRQTITARLSLWLEPQVDNATSRSDFKVDRLRTGAVTLYLATGPANLPLVAPLYALIMQQLVEHTADTLPQPGDRRQLLFMMDEFAQLGPVPAIVRAFAISAGYGMRLAAVIQTPAQLRHLYGPEGARTILANCGAELIFAPKELEDARNISERLGEYDFPALSRSRPAGLSSGRRSISRSEHGRRLMLSHELLTMKPDTGLVIRTGAPPTLCRKIVWHRDRHLRKLPKPAPPITPLVDLRSAHGRPATPVHATAQNDLFEATLDRRR